MTQSRYSRLAGALLMLAATIVTAQVPDRLNYQGVLKRGDGSSIGEGYHDIQFRIWDAATGGRLIWARTHRAHTDANGLFNVVLMEEGSPIAGAQTESLATVFTSSAGDERYLELTVAGSTPIMPRQRFVTAPYAFMANDVQQAKANFTVQGALTVQQGAQVHSLTVDDDASVGGDLTVTGNTTFNGSATAAGGPLTANHSSYGPKLILDDTNPDNKVPIDFRANGQLKWELGQRPESEGHDLRLYRYTTSWHGVMRWDQATSEVTAEGDMTVEDNLTVQGYNFFNVGDDYDVWIQGGHAGNVQHDDERNLALLGTAEDEGDKLYVNYASEYGNGTKIGGPVEITSWKTKSIEANGYVNMGGLYIQWGVETSTSDDDQGWEFPTAFPNACLSVVVNRKESGVSSPLCAHWWRKDRFSIDRDNGIDGSETFSYIAVGH